MTNKEAGGSNVSGSVVPVSRARSQYDHARA
jgi:hypothetical protein